jgi:hypothetical protein
LVNIISVIQEAEKEVTAALEERDEAIHDLQAAQSRHSEEIEARYSGLTSTHQNNVTISSCF